MFIDTHCHANIIVKKNFDTLLTVDDIQSVQAIINTAQQYNVNKLINVGTSLTESMNCVALAKRYQSCYAAVGIHPNDAHSTWRNEINSIKYDLLPDIHTISRNKIVAIGEVGLDYHYPHPNKQRQKDVFHAFIDLALDKDLAIIVHTRDASDDTLDILQEYRHDPLRGVIHCFSEDQCFADQIIQQGLVLGIGGSVSYPRNNTLRHICTQISLDHIILETDAPYLSPQKVRGTPNNPANIVLIAEFLAQLRSVSIDVIAQHTTKNATSVFRL